MAKKTQKLTPPPKISEEVVVTKEDIYSLAKSKGYTDNDSIYEIQAWIRKKFGIHAEIFYSMFHKKFSINNYFVDVVNGKKIEWNYTSKNYDSHDDALIFALFNILNII